MGIRTSETIGEFSCKCFSILLITAGSSMQAHLSRTTTDATGCHVNFEHPFQSLSPGYCHGWHVCRFCRSKNRSSQHGVVRVFSHPDPLPHSGCPCPAWPESPTPGVCCLAQTHRDKFIRNEFGQPKVACKVKDRDVLHPIGSG